MENNNIRIQVYGTLKRGFGLNDVLSNSKFIGEGETVNKYMMTGTNKNIIPYTQDRNKQVQIFKQKDKEYTPFPYVFENVDQYHIKVEIYQVDKKTLNECDRIEGVPHHYKRKTVPIMYNRKQIDCEMYFINEKEVI